MKPLIKTLLLACTFLAASSTLAADNILTVAIFDFDSVYKVKLHLISDLVTANLSAEPQLVIVDRATLVKSLREQALGLSGNISPEAAAKVGQLTGAKVLVTGRLFHAGKDWSIIAKIIGTESGRVYTETAQGRESELTKLATELSQKITKTITEQATNLLAKVDPRGSRIDRIIKSAKGEKRPVVLLTVAEQYPDKTTTISTAETELGYILQRAGFTLVDEQGSTKAEVEITGDATTDAAKAESGLFSCRAVIEIKVKDRLTGKILAFDRQKSTGLDIGKQTAAKAALENAADELAERLVPVLSQ
jgi:TolB-like protein